MRVRLCAVKSRAVSNRNCVVATRGGEQRNENDQSVTEASRVGSRGELDTVGVAVRAFEREAKPVGAGVNPLAAGRPPVNPPMGGDGMVGSPPAVIRETRRGEAEFMAGNSPKSRLAGVRASGVAKKRVTTVERRDAGKWMANELERRRHHHDPGGSGGDASTSRRSPRAA